MSGPIASRWTGAGLPAGTEITTENVNTAGNGAEVTVSGLSGAGGTMVREGSQGVRVTAPASGIIRRFDVPISGTGVLLQCQMKVDTLPTGDAHTFAQVRSTSASVRSLTIALTGRIGVGGLANTTFSPAIAVTDRVLVDAAITQASSPTASNGRVFFRVKNLSNPTWNETGEYFYDSGYTVDAGTVAFAQARFMKMASEVIPTPGIHYESVGWEPITVNPAHTTEAQAKAYFADAPVVPLAPSTGVVRPLAGPGTGGAGWGFTGAASEGEALSDGLDSSYVESGDIAVGSSTERIYRLAPRQAWASGSTLEIDLRAMIRDMPVSGQTPVTTQVKVYNGSTVVATQTVTVGGSLATATVKLTATQTAGLNPAAIDVGLRAAR